jgi:hypothetical protein
MKQRELRCSPKLLSSLPDAVIYFRSYDCFDRTSALTLKIDSMRYRTGAVEAAVTIFSERSSDDNVRFSINGTHFWEFGKFLLFVILNRYKLFGSKRKAQRDWIPLFR